MNVEFWSCYNNRMDLGKITKYIISIVVLCAVLFIGVFFIYIKKQNLNYLNYYKQGENFYNKGDFQNAYYNFSRILPASDLFLNSLYKQAKCADQLNDTKTALNKYKTLEKLIKNEDITPFFIWRQANIYLEENNNKKAYDTLLKLKKNYENSEYAIASSYMLYKIDNKKENLIEYLQKSPKGKYSLDAIAILSGKLNELNQNEKIILAGSLYENEKYKEEIEVLKTVQINKSWVYLIKALDKLKSKENVLKVGRKAFAFDNTDIDEETLYEVLMIFANNSKNKIEASNEIYKIAKNPVLKGVALYINSEFLPYNEGLIQKRKFYENYQNSKYAPYALFVLFVENLINNKVALAQKYGKIHLALYKNKETTPLILYFSAYLKRYTNDESYKDLTSRLFEEYPNSYYSYLAYSNLINPEILKSSNKKITNKINIEYPYPENKKLAKFYENFIKEKDFTPFNDFRIKNNIILSWLEYKKGNRAQSAVIARNYIQNQELLPDRNNVIWKLAYPIYYQKEINNYALQKNLTNYLILALIKEESHFNPNIISPAGAIGLTQIMPSTAEMLTGKVYANGELFNETLNIDAGTSYFKYLMNEFLNNEKMCVLAYNSGPNAVKKWLNDNPNLNFDILVEKIPYPETKYYIKKIYGAYWNYILTYENLKI